MVLDIPQAYPIINYYIFSHIFADIQRHKNIKLWTT